MRLSFLREFNVRRISFIAYLLLVVSLCIFLLSIWFSSETRQTARQIGRLEEKETVLESEISKLNVQMERLHSAENVSKIAEKFGMVRAEEVIELEVK